VLVKQLGLSSCFDSPQLGEVYIDKAWVVTCLPILAVVDIRLSVVHFFQPAHSSPIQQ